MKKKTLIIISLSALASIAFFMLIFYCLSFVTNCIELLSPNNKELSNFNQHYYLLNYLLTIENCVVNGVHIFFSIVLGFASIFSIIQIAKHATITTKRFIILLIAILFALKFVSQLSCLVCSVYDCNVLHRVEFVISLVVCSGSILLCLFYLVCTALCVICLFKEKTTEELEEIKQRKIENLQKKIDKLQTKEN